MNEYIKQITSRQALDIIDTRKPIGLFILEGEFGYVGIDNTTGDAWTEEFKSKNKCMKWLNNSEPMQSFSESEGFVKWRNLQTKIG